MLKTIPSGMILKLGDYLPAVEKRIEELEKIDFVNRLWAKDPSLWKDDPKAQEDIRQALGWLEAVPRMQERLGELSQFAQEVRKAGLGQVVHMGMGGSSLAPLTFKEIFAGQTDGLPLMILDTTDPATIRKIEESFPLERTLFIVASKSGTTAEPLAFGEYFYYRLREIKGERAGQNFVAITDPGSYLGELARKRDFRKVFWGYPDIGGRYSALSPFGLVPATLMGLSLKKILERTRRMIERSRPQENIHHNGGAVLGAILGELALQGREKVPLFLPKSIRALGLWLEQLLAESTGKEGKGILPIEGEPWGSPPDYQKDRLFVFYHLQNEKGGAEENFLKELERIGQPLIIIQMNDYLDLFPEFWRWEIATATAGAILKINPFDQPNVQESKEITNSFLKQVQQGGKLPEAQPTLKEGPLSFFSPWPGKDGQGLLSSFFKQRQPDSYLALLAFLPEEPGVNNLLQFIRQKVLNHFHLATTLGFGPRYLHSTGQFHKGGPNKGLFLMLTMEERGDVSIPNYPYSFGALKMAQALGDLEALKKHGRPALRIHLGFEIEKGLESLIRVMEKLWAATNNS